MSNLPGVGIDGATYFRSAQENTVEYVPGSPAPEVDAMGNPSTTLMLSGAGGILQLGAHWEVSASALESARVALATAFPEMVAEQIRFAPADVKVQSVNLELGEETNRQVLGQSTSSQAPPYTALFNVPLNAAQAALVASALKGNSKKLVVTYAIEVPIAVRVTAVLKGDVSQLIPPAGGATGALSTAECETLLRKAIDAGQLAIDVDAPTLAPSAVGDELREEVIRKASQVLAQLVAGSLSPADVTTVSASAASGNIVRIPIVRQADVGLWFSNRTTGVPRVLMYTSPADQSTSPAPFSVLVRMPANAASPPIAFVELSSGTAKATLRPPTFSPVTLLADASGQIEVRTRYTDGGGPFVTQVAAAGSEVQLQLGHLGLAQVSIDATARRAAGMRRLRLHAAYTPADPDAPSARREEHDSSFVYGDWTDSWIVTSRNPQFAGTLEYSWQETDAAGNVVDHPNVRITSSFITL